MHTIDGKLEKRGWGRWSEVSLQLNANQLTYLDKSGKVKDHFEVEHLQKLSSTQKGEEFAFEIHFKSGGKKDKWTLRAPDQAEFSKWTTAIQENLQQLGRGDTYNYGLPANDPRTDLPLISVPSDFVSNFGYLNMAVVHWFGVVKKLGTGFSVEERIAVLGDRCLYMCKRNADITRCVMVSDIVKLLLAQDDNKDLYIAIIMPETIDNKAEADKPPRVEYDLMFHSDDIQTFVRYLRTVYVYQTSGKGLDLQQVRDKRQLETDVRLARPKNWELTYWQPMFKEHLAQLLEVWYKQQKQTQQQQPQVLQQQQQAANQMQVTSQSTAQSQQQKTEALDDSDPLGKFLVMLSLSKYYTVMRENNISLEMMVSGLIDDSDLFHFGIENEQDCRTIIQGLQDKDLIDRLTNGTVSNFNPPQMPSTRQKKEELDSDFSALRPNLATDDDLDLDLGPSTTPAKKDFSFDDLDLDDFGPMAAPVGKPSINLDDFDLDLSPAPAKPPINDFDDLDLSPAPAKGGKAPISLDDDFDLDLGPPKTAGPPPDLDDL